MKRAGSDDRATKFSSNSFLLLSTAPFPLHPCFLAFFTDGRNSKGPDSSNSFGLLVGAKERDVSLLDICLESASLAGLVQ